MKKTNKEILLEIGGILKEDLKHCQYYIGVCRNSNVAKWDANRQKFIHLRTKFGKTFAEEINHPEDDDGFDLFIPYEEIPNHWDSNWKYKKGRAGKLFPKE